LLSIGRERAPTFHTVCAPLRLIEAGCSEDQAVAITGHRDLNVLRADVRGTNQQKLARQAIRKQEAAG
jgi:hypothetical protein